jgi:acetyl esterase/lipase
MVRFTINHRGNFAHRVVSNLGESKWEPPKGYTLTKYEENGLPIELLECENGLKEKVILQFHGGAYIIPLIDIYRKIAYRYSRISKGASVVTIDYRCAPDCTFPAALDDAHAAWEWLLKQGYSEENIIIVGDSAGGNLVLALTSRLRDEGRKLPQALILMSPWTDLAAEGESYVNNLYKDPMFGLRKKDQNANLEEKIKFFRSYAGNTDLHDPYLSPAYGHFEHFPHMLIQVGSHEMLESDARTIYDKATAAGVNVTFTHYEGMFHVFQLFGDLIPEAHRAWREVESFIDCQFHSEK